MKIYNSLTNIKEEFSSLEPKKVRMYVCGVTPYDTTHLGHAFTYLQFDVLKRFLEYKGYEVTYVQNVTDIDDSILEKAQEVNQDWKELGDFWTKRFLEDLKNLNIALPTHFVKATDSIPKIIQIVSGLLKKGFAYQKNGNIYFEVSKFKDYSKLSKYTRSQMILISKERGADPNDPNKRDPLDFILWQKSKADEPSWDSPWGAGRPGWHIECSAMIHQYLGKQIDIHGGGRDLIYPHHESEIAQSESYTLKSPFSKFWMHIGMVMCDGEKMSKSLGNLVLVKDLLEKYDPNVLRWALLKHHYKRPWEFDMEQMHLARLEFNYVLKQIKKFNAQKQLQKKLHLEKTDQGKKFLHALNNDLNTPEALNIILRIAEQKIQNSSLEEVFLMLKILGFLVQSI